MNGLRVCRILHFLRGLAGLRHSHLERDGLLTENTDLVETARALTAEAKDNRWAKAMDRVTTAWPDIVQAVLTRAEDGYDSALLSARNVRWMKTWDYDDRDALVVRFQNLEFRARQDDNYVYVYWYHERGKK